MKTMEEIGQMEAAAAALTSLMRIALRDETALVEYDAESDALVNHCGTHKLNRRVNVGGDSCPTAIRDFVEACCRG